MTLAQSFAKSKYRPAQGSGGAINQESKRVAASQNIKYGDIVSLSSSQVQQALALPGANNTATTSTGNLPMLGIALDSIVTDSTGTEAITGKTTIPVAIWDGNLEWIPGVWSATAASATSGTLAQGTSYWLARVRGASASEWGYMVSSDAPTNGELKFIEASAETTTTETYGLGIFRPVISDTVRQG